MQTEVPSLLHCKYTAYAKHGTQQVVPYQEEELQAVYYGADAQDWFPVLAQDVQADVALKVNVWVEDLQMGVTSL